MKSPIQEQAEARLRRAISAVEKIMPDGIGITVLVFERNTDRGNIGYIANARREDMRRALTEFLKKWEGDAAGQPFYPLTLDAFEAWVVEHAKSPRATGWLAPVSDALTMYRYLSNSGPTNSQDVAQA